jgi:hypothetical protein
VRARRPCAARTRLFGLIATPNGALRAPPPRPLQLRCFKLNLSNWGRPRHGPFPFHRNTETMKYEVHLPPASPIAALPILPALFWGQIYVPVPPYALCFLVYLFYSFWIFSFYYSRPFLLSFSIFLILLFLSLLILLFLSLLILLV